MKGKRIEVKQGQTFGFLTTIEEAPRRRSGKRMASNRYFLCKCTCGNKKEVKLSNLTHGKTKSCGCYNPRITHKMTKTPTYASWREMKRRCNCEDKNRQCYQNYKKNSVTYDPKWESFENFLKDMGERPEGMTLDRKDPFGNYNKKNCRWATHYEQSSNKRNSVKTCFKGRQYKSVAELSKTFGIHNATIRQRMKNGWPLEKVLLTPPGKNGKKRVLQ